MALKVLKNNNCKHGINNNLRMKANKNNSIQMLDELAAHRSSLKKGRRKSNSIGRCGILERPLDEVGTGIDRSLRDIAFGISS